MLQLLLAIALWSTGLFLVWLIASYFLDPYGLKKLKSPSIWAPLTNIWIAYFNIRHIRFLKVHDAHKKYGPVVRLGPSLVSISDPQAIKEIHGHGTNIIKDVFYDIANPNVHQSMAETRSNNLHHKKRKILSHIFSATKVQEVMEPLVQLKTQQLVDAMDYRQGETCNMKNWFNYFAYDVISAILFSDSYDFLLKGNDICTAETLDGKRYEVHAGYSFQHGATFSAFIGHFKPHVANLLRVLLSWSSIQKASKDFTNMVIYRVNERINRKSDSNKDVFSLFQGMSDDEIFAECSTFLNAGNDTTHNALTNAAYLLATNPHALSKLRDILDEIPPADGDVYTFDQVQDIPYLRACIDEAFRLRPPVGIGLPRVIPPEGAYICGQFYKPNVTVSTPIYTINRDHDLFSEADEYKPDRWTDESEEKENLKNYCLPFLTGARACIGRNLAYLEQTVLIATIVRNFNFEVVDKKPMRTIERFNMNPEKLNMKLSRRVKKVT